MSQIVIPKQAANKNREELLADAASGLLGLTVSARVEISRKEKGRRDRIHLYSDIGATEKLVTIQCKELYPAVSAAIEESDAFTLRDEFHYGIGEPSVLKIYRRVDEHD